MNIPKRYLVTSALPYANGPIHIGHLAGAYLPADIYVRYLRLQGKDVAFICGSDEHGAAITMRAKKEGVTPKSIVDKYHSIIKKGFEGIGISFDMYHRTSDPLHHETATDFFKTVYDKGIFIEQESEQYYDEKEKTFLADRYIKGTCPKCAYEEAYGDQCEKCGSTLSPLELINPKSSQSGNTPIMKKTKHWYIPLGGENQKWLKNWIVEGKGQTEKWKKNVLGQAGSWLSEDLLPRSITRDIDWGIPVPVEGAEGKVLYVWFDAPIGYISATKQWAADNGKDWELYWKNKDTKLVHFIGKDNIVFHTIIFPSMLRMHGDYILPTNVPANEFMNLEGSKISTSRNWAVWLHEFLEELPEYKDVLRYALIKNMPETKDSEFTWQGFQDANDNELVATFANFVNRVVVLTNKYYSGVVPEYNIDANITGSEGQHSSSYYDSELIDIFDKIYDINTAIERYDFRGALKYFMELANKGNKLLQFNEPWKQQKTDPDVVKVVMNLSLQIVTVLSITVRPFLPFTSDKLRGILNLPPLEDDGEWTDMLNDLAEGKDLIPVGHKIGAPSHLFSKIPNAIIDQQIKKLADSKKSQHKVSYAPVKPVATFDDFTKLDIRTGTITEAEKIRKTKKLLKITVDLGFESRTVVSGIAEHYTPAEIIGKSVLVVANLAPRKLKGIESEGMILMAENDQGEMGFVSPESGFGTGWLVK